jgi:hypothetical protein
VLPITEHWFNLWRQSGLGLDDAVLAGSITSMALLGLVEEELLFAEMDLPDPETMTSTPTARMAFQGSFDNDAAFELLARSIIDGVYARLSEEGDTAAPSGSRASRTPTTRSAL